MGFDCPCEELDSPVECEPNGCWIGNWSGGMPRVKDNGGINTREDVESGRVGGCALTSQPPSAS